MFRKIFFCVFVFWLSAGQHVFCCERKISSNSRIITDVLGISIRNITCVETDGKGNLMVGTSDAGLFLRNNGVWTHQNTTKGLSHDSVHAIACDREGNIWVGTAAGLNRIRKEGKGIDIRYAETGFEDNIVKSLACDDGNLYIGTTKGLAVADLEGNVRKTFTVDDGLPSNIINCVYSVDQEMLYIGTAAGLAVRDEGGIQCFEPLERKWVSCIAASKSPATAQNNNDSFVSRLKLFYSILLVELQARGRKGKSPEENDLIHTAVLNIRNLMDQLTQTPDRYVYVGTSDGCYELDHSRVLEGDLSEAAVISMLWITGLDVDRNGNAWMGSKNGCLSSTSNTSVFSDSLDGFSEMIESSSKGQDSGKRLENEISKDIVSVRMDVSGNLYTAIQGVGLMSATKILINHDAVYYAMINKKSSEFSLSSPPSNLSQSTISMCEKFSGFIRSTFPTCKIWQGKFMDLCETDLKNVAYLVGRYGLVVCILNLSRILRDNPVILIPYSN